MSGDAIPYIFNVRIADNIIPHSEFIIPNFYGTKSPTALRGVDVSIDPC